ncbi:hypothetical protein SteCoe_20416 [Stentor coeruleus]|uniref:Mitofilin n=1 Tax=Stentor coeruleus TaxID=5963 RepID=A0A1R2BRV7_9CILI|nr:hypothetical protein SteCoe_20416 [Stentor coeruleus]
MWTVSKRLYSSLKNFLTPSDNPNPRRGLKRRILLITGTGLVLTQLTRFIFESDINDAKLAEADEENRILKEQYIKFWDNPKYPLELESKAEELKAEIKSLKTEIVNLKAETEKSKPLVEIAKLELVKPKELVIIDEITKFKVMLETIGEINKREKTKDEIEAKKNVIFEEKKVESSVVAKDEVIEVEAKKESLVNIEKSEEREISIMNAQEIEVFIAKLKADMEAEQKLREEALYEKVEKSFLSLLNDFSAKAEHADLPAGSLSAHIEFSKFIVEELQKKYETFIMAYEDRLENLGVKHYDSFIERIKVEKAKWKSRMEELQTQYEKDVEAKIHERDDNWKKILENEYVEGQRHFEAQSKINEEFAQQEAELRLTHSFKQELDEINRNLKESSEIPKRQVKEIIEKIREMEQIQDDHNKILTRLIEIHKLHLAIENLQRALQSDQGNLTKDFETVIAESKNNEIVSSYFEKVKIHYPQIIEFGIPKMNQIRNSFIEASHNARRAALVKNNSPLSIIASRIAINFVSRNVRTVDENDTFSILMKAEQALDAGDLRGALKEIDRLRGLPKEQMLDIAKNIDLRLSINEFIEILSGHSSQVVRQLLSSKALS